MPKVFSGARRALSPRPVPPDIDQGAKSRMFYAIGEANWVAVDQLSANTYLAALMIYMGFADGDIGTIMSLSALVCVVQLLTLSLNRFFRGKKMVVALTSLMRLWMAFLYFIPFLPISTGVKPLLFVAVYFIARSMISFGGPAASEWVAQLTPMPIRGRYLGTKDATAVGLQAVVLLAAGMVLDRYKASEPLHAFAILGVMILGLCIVGYVAYMFAEDRKNPVPAASEPRQKMMPQIARCLRDRNFRILMTVDCLWQLTYYISCPYNASYSIKELGLSFTFISAVGFGANIARIFIARKLGAWADRTSMGRILRYTVFLLGLHHLVWAAMRPETAVGMYILMSVLSTTAWSFIGVGLFGVKLELMPEGGRQVQLAVTAAVSGVVGFVMSFISGRLLDAMQKIDMSLFGMVIYPQQILNLLGFCCTIIMCLYIKLVVEREEEKLKA